ASRKHVRGGITGDRVVEARAVRALDAEQRVGPAKAVRRHSSQQVDRDGVRIGRVVGGVGAVDLDGEHYAGLRRRKRGAAVQRVVAGAAAQQIVTEVTLE